MERTTASANSVRPTAQNRSFAKRIAELALFLELTEPEASGALEAATKEFASGRGIPSSTLKRCASEARALMEHAHATGAAGQIVERADGAAWRLQQEISAWVDDVSLPAILKERALRLNRSRGGRPSSQTRTLRAVEELLEYAKAGRPGALDELRSIKALIESGRAPAPTRS